MEDSIRDIDIISKNIGQEIKSFIKDKNSDYKSSLKELLRIKFDSYFSTLLEKEKTKVEEQNKELSDIQIQLNKHRSQLIHAEELIKKKKEIEKNLLIKYHNIRLKRKLFDYLKENKDKEKNERKIDTQVLYLYITKLKRKYFNLIKNKTILKPLKIYEQEVDEKYKVEIKSILEKQGNEKGELIKLIHLAQEKLKHEQRKKIQTKLMLDNIVLKGVSAMNIQALSLSNNSLKDLYMNNLGKIENDYLTLINTNTTLKKNK